MTIEELIALAVEAREYAYAPYSAFRVGAALLTKSGQVFTGANVENASYGLTVCAERNAMFKAVNAGRQDFATLVIVGSAEGMVYPCGACLQVMAEFAPQLKIVVTDQRLAYKVFSLSEMLPQIFNLREKETESPS
jgi:cytidine deaminase